MGKGGLLMKNRKNSLIKSFALSALLLFGGIGAAIGANTATNKSNAAYATSDSDDGLYTTIVLKDTIGWKFRTLWLDSFSYSSGYNQTQRNLFLAGEYLYNFESWDGTAKNGERGPGYHTSGGGTNLATGEKTGTCTFHIPAWITSCSVLVEDDSHSINIGTIDSLSTDADESGRSGDAGSGVGKTINIDVKNVSGHAAASIEVSNTKVYSDAVTVNRYFLKSDGSSVKTTDTVTRHKYYFGKVDKVAVDGYATNNKWYVGTDYSASNEYTTSNIITSTTDINLVAKYEVGSNDSSLELRFTRKSDWGNHTVRVHTWNEGGSGTTWLQGYIMTYLWDGSTQGDTIWSWSPSFDEPLYGLVKFYNDGHGMESANFTSPSKSTNYWYNNGWQSGDVEQEIIYLLDYANVYEGNVDVHLTRESTTFSENVKAVQMIDVATNGLMYKVTFSNRYNRMVFSNDGEDSTGTLTPPATNYVYILGNGVNDWWNNINYALAYNFAQRTMLMDTIPTSDHSSTPYCAQRYNAAKTHFNALMASDYGTYVLAELNSGFATAMDRFDEWAKANGEGVNNATGVISKNNTIFLATDVDSTILVLVIVSVSAVMFCGFLLLRRKRR